MSGHQDDHADNHIDMAKIQLMHIKSKHRIRLQHLISACWFMHEIQSVTSKDEEDAFFRALPGMIKRQQICDLLITDFRSAGALGERRRLELMERLREARCPLITLSDARHAAINDKDPNWLHISLPADQTDRAAQLVKEHLANFWFCLPTN